ncbi:hypothetical protein GlitD10_1149 [Gloeomargarita lithophora Alchichica-D10]|uniref:Uncharacterized protein n=1 Tax=Gloeomargarita lithophora Alchichica-D10 TaxID=1188229 RepID=A0A1J0AC18_9CYAN|nr:hypothetical protein [Gloeomargarita lithophora]APB33469.1 hypothetical protein GlitD10_1149 [Gloeomargarita lithophora Alchichica-D10]
MVINQLLLAWDSWSREYCIAICGTFVPLMFLLTGATVLGLWFPFPRRWMTLTASLAGGCGLLLCLHVLSWFRIGVVHPVTFILVGLSLLCGTVNAGAVWRGRTRLALGR